MRGTPFQAISEDDQVDSQSTRCPIAIGFPNGHSKPINRLVYLQPLHLVIYRERHTRMFAMNLKRPVIHLLRSNHDSLQSSGLVTRVVES